MLVTEPTKLDVVRIKIVETQTIDKLDALAALRGKINDLLLKKKELIDKVFTLEIKESMDRIEKQFVKKLGMFETEASLLEETVRSNVKELQATVFGTLLKAIIVKGRETWDTKSLEGYAAGGHPEILKFKKTGDLSVRICNVTNSDKD